MASQELLFKLTTQVLAPDDKQIVDDARSKMNLDPWYRQGAGFSPAVEARHVGFSFSGQPKKAVPVYQALHELVAVEHEPSTRSVQSWPVAPTEVYLDEHRS